MLKFHQNETCEGIIRHLEMREGAARHDVRLQDIGNLTSPDARVEMTFRLGNQLYAIEHTGVEPFDGFLAHQNRARDLFDPLEAGIKAAISNLITNGVVFELRLPIDGLSSRKLPEVRTIHAAIVAWVKATAPTLPVELYADRRATLATARPSGVPFEVSLVRWGGIPSVPGMVMLKHVTTNSGAERTVRLQRACDTKFPKLTAWKHSDNARTILVLEDNDLQLSNPSIIADTFLPIATARTDRPDETYVVDTCGSTWYSWPLLINNQSFFDLSELYHPIYFEMAPTGQITVPHQYEIAK